MFNHGTVNQNTYGNNCDSWLFLSRLAGAVLGELGEMVGDRCVNVVVHCRLDVLQRVTPQNMHGHFM